MDVPVRRLWAALALGSPLLAGCGLFDRETDRRVQAELRAPARLPTPSGSPPVPTFATESVPRGQAPTVPTPAGPTPAGPIQPGPLPPSPIGPSSPPSATLPPSTPPAPVSALPPSVDPSSPVPPPSALPSAAPSSRVKMVATVGPESFVTDEEVSMMVRQRAKDYVSLTGPERTAKEKEVWREELKRLIERELIIAEFVGRVKKNKPEALPEVWGDASKMADRQLKELRRSNDLGDEAKFTQALDAMGLDLKTYKRSIEREMMTQMYLRELLKDKGKTIGLADIEDYYKRNPKEFKIDDRAVWQHLFISTTAAGSPAEAKAKAEQLLKAAQGGADLAKLAAQHGHGDSALRSGEGSGTKRGEILPRELEPTVLSLKVGQLSGLVVTPTGYHVAKVTERDVAGVRPFDAKLQEEVRKKLTDQLTKRERDKVVGDLWRRSAVTILDDKK